MIDGWGPTVELAALPSPDSDVWEARYDNDAERGKITTRRVADLPDPLPGLFERMRSPASVMYWQGTAGLRRLTDDPTMHGGGLHAMLPDGHLGCHLDYDAHPKLPGKRRAFNLICFLNPEWKTEWGGALCLCDPMGEPVARIFPAPGRLVAFPTDDLSYHSVEPVTGSVPRVTAAVYYLAPARPSATRKRAMFMPKR